MSEAAPFTWMVRVYWEDTDAGGVVYHASYLRFLERARTEWLRARGVDQIGLKRERGLAFLVRDMQLDFRHPALLDDELAITLTVTQCRAASILFAQTVVRADGICLVQANVRVACVDMQRMRPAPIPEDLLPSP
ncbi:MAG: tol-pal system-associated acyl-CoA thioesterase [Xanthomonadales bacterium]|nr:tol-pal system-associated acyl-CoA thioesterase [Xanthomonadales bacterium]